MFLLCTFIDQERWSSAFEPLLYPSGLGFYRPFSYRKRYFQPEAVWDSLSDPVTASNFLATSATGYFGIRFRDDSAPLYKKRFVALRQVSLSAIERSDGMSMFFRLGDYVVPQSSGGTSLLPTFDLSSIVADADEPKLFIELSAEQANSLGKCDVAGAFPGEVFWNAFEQALSGPARTAVSDAVVLRLVSMFGRGGRGLLETEDIDPSRHLWGYRLQERNLYDLVLSYYRILPSKEKRSRLAYSVSNPREEMRVSRGRIPVTGNYRSEDLWISPLAQAEAPIYLEFEGCITSELPDGVPNDEQKLIGLKLPVLIDPMDWPFLRKAYLAVAVVSLVGAVIAFQAYLAGDESLQKLLLVVIAASVSLGLSTLKDVVAYKK